MILGNKLQRLMSKGEFRLITNNVFVNKQIFISLESQNDIRNIMIIYFEFMYICNNVYFFGLKRNL